MFFKFIWGGSEKVKRTTLITDYECGGLKMIHFKSFLDSMKLTWIKKLLYSEASRWKNIPLFILNNTKLGINVFKCNCSFENMNAYVRSLINDLPSFYKNLVKTWLSTNRTLTHEQVNNWGDQVIWNNICITSNGKVLHYTEWINKGIVFVSDMYDKDGNFLSLDRINHKFNQPGSIYFQYQILKQAILKVCKSHKISSTGTSNDKPTMFYYGNSSVEVRNCPTKLYKHTMISKISTKPISQNMWKNKFRNRYFDWTKIWKSIVRDEKEPRLKTLNWKILSNVYATKVFLHRVGKTENNICETCNKTDYIEHFFFDCTKVHSIWIEISHLIYTKYDVRHMIEKSDVLFGYNEDENSKNINKLISIAKLTISKYKYGKYPDIISLLYTELRVRNIL